MQSEKAKELAQKLYEVAKRGGTDAEKMSAQKLLEKHLARHGMTMQDIESDDLHEYSWAIARGLETRFFRQVIASVVGREGYEKCDFKEFEIDRRINRNIEKHKYGLSFKVTASEFVLISERMHFFWHHFTDELEIFFSAYVQKNELFSNPDRTPQGKSREDLEELFRIQQMMRNIEKTSIPEKEKQVRSGTLSLGDGNE